LEQIQIVINVPKQVLKLKNCMTTLDTSILIIRSWTD